MWLLDTVRENYEVPVALFVGLLFIWWYRRILRVPEDEGHTDHQSHCKTSSEETSCPTPKPVTKKVQFNHEEPRKSGKQDLEDQVDCPSKPTDVVSLHAAVKNGDVDAVRTMLEEGADPNIPDRDSNNCLHIIFRDISTMPLEDANEIFQMLLSNLSSGVNAVNKDGKTPLHLATRHTTPSLVRLLLDSGADRSAADQDGNTPLHTIIEYMQFSQVPAEKEILDLLVKYWPSEEPDNDTRSKSGINEVNDENLTPLHMAVMYEETDNVRVLLEAGADPNVPDSEGNTPLHTMIMTLNQEAPLSPEHRDMLTLLLDAKADVVVKNKKGESVLCLVTSQDVEEEIMKT